MSPKSFFLNLLKIVAVVAIFAWLIHKGHLDLNAFRISSSANLIFLVLAAMCVFLNMILQTVRSKMLFNAQHYHLNWGPFLKISWISYFFCTFLPGGVTSDIVKYSYLQRTLKQSRTVTALTLITDRACGLIALVLLAFCASCVAVWLSPHNGPYLRNMLLFSGLALLCIGLTVTISMHPNTKNFSLLRPLHRLNAFHTLTEALQKFRNKVDALLIALILSMVAHSLTLLGMYFLQHMFYDTAPLSFLLVFIVFPVAMLVSVIPIAPQGFGVSQVALVTMATLFNIPNTSMAVTVYTAMQGVALICFLTGAIPYIGYKQKQEWVHAK